MQKIIMLVSILLNGIMTFACAPCESAQPRYLKGITHGTGPESNWDFLIISLIASIVIATLFLSIKWLVRPGEKSVTHIKHLILNID